MRSRRLVFSLILVALLGPCPRAQAQSEPLPPHVRTARAREHIKAGVTLDKAGDSLAALAEFERAYELEPDFALLYNIAQEQYKLGRAADAVQTLRRYLQLGGNEIDAARRRRLALQLEQYESLQAKLLLTSAIAGAEVSIDDERVGTTPLSGELTLTPGVHWVVVTFDGVPVSRSITLAEGERATLEVAPPAPVPAPMCPVLPPRKCPAAGTTTIAPVPVADRRGLSTAAILTGSGLVVGGAAAILAVWNHNDFEQWQARDAELDRNRSASDYLSQVQHHNDDAAAIENWGIASLALGIGGAALLAAGGTLLALDLAEDDHPKPILQRTGSSALVVVCDQRSGAVSWKGVF